MKRVIKKLKPPGKRADCESVNRPCPFVFCRYNLLTNIRKSGLLEVKPRSTEYSCVLDVIEENGRVSLPEVGRIMNITQERVRQIELKALYKLREAWEKDAYFKEYSGTQKKISVTYGRAS